MEFLEIPYISIAQIPCETIQFVSWFEILCKPDTKRPQKFIIYLACDKEKTGILEFPVYLPIELIETSTCQLLRQEFEDGAPFVAISCSGLKVYEKQTSNGVQYVGYADDFVLVYDANERIEEEIWR